MDRQDEHDALTFRRNLHTIADAWPHLHARITGGTSTDRSGVHAIPTSKPPIDLSIVKVMDEIEDWARFLVRILHTETTDTYTWLRGTPWARRTITRPWRPRVTSVVGILREVADERSGHFTEHHDTALTDAVIADAKHYARLITRRAWPTGAKRIRLGHRCPADDCTGVLFIYMRPDEYLSDLICDHDELHRLTPLEWQRIQRQAGRAAGTDRDMDDLLHGSRIRHTSQRMGA